MSLEHVAAGRLKDLTDHPDQVQRESDRLDHRVGLDLVWLVVGGQRNELEDRGGLGGGPSRHAA